MFCRKCGVQIPDDSETCPVCGEEQYRTTTEEMEKGEGAGKTAEEILKGAGKAVAKVVGPILIGAGSAIAAMVSEEVGKGLQKKTKKWISKGMKATGLKNKTPLDKAGDAVKALQKKARK